MSRLLERLALHRPELRAWAMYDWANSAFITVIVTAVWPLYYKSVSGLESEVATARHGYFTAAALALVAILAPVLGTIADRAPIKKKFLASFAIFGAASTAALALVADGQWLFGGILFALGNVGASSSFVFYDALLPHIATEDEMDRVSIAGYAIGYVGGALLLAFCLAMILKPEPFGLTASSATKLTFVIVAVWWVVFSIPLLRRVPEPPITRAAAKGNVVAASFRDLAATARDLSQYKHAALFLLAFLIYNDGIGTIIRMATSYGEEKDLAITIGSTVIDETSVLIGSIIIVQIVGIPFTFLFGQISGKIGTRKSIYIGLLVYCGVSVLGYFLETGYHFLLLAFLVGLVQGGVQALSRSLFATMIPKAKSGEFFALFAVFEKFAGIIGPLLFAVIIDVTGSSRTAILAIISFFVIGGALLAFVDIEKGRAQAKAEDAAARA